MSVSCSRRARCGSDRWAWRGGWRYRAVTCRLAPRCGVGMAAASEDVRAVRPADRHVRQGSHAGPLPAADAPVQPNTRSAAAGRQGSRDVVQAASSALTTWWVSWPRTQQPGRLPTNSPASLNASPPRGRAAKTVSPVMRQWAPRWHGLRRDAAPAGSRLHSTRSRGRVFQTAPRRSAHRTEVYTAAKTAPGIVPTASLPPCQATPTTTRPNRPGSSWRRRPCGAASSHW